MNPKQFEKALAEATNIVKGSLTSARNRAPLEDVADILEKIFPQHFSTSGSHWWVTVQFRMKTIEEVTPVLRYITGVAGLHQVGEKVQNGTELTWTFGEQYKAELQVKVFFEGKCRMVKVGEETIVKDIMEMRCDDEETDAPPIVGVDVARPENPTGEPAADEDAAPEGEAGASVEEPEPKDDVPF